jgi:hypothetical protein
LFWESQRVLGGAQGVVLCQNRLKLSKDVDGCMPLL